MERERNVDKFTNILKKKTCARCGVGRGGGRPRIFGSRECKYEYLTTYLRNVAVAHVYVYVYTYVVH